MLTFKRRQAGLIAIPLGAMVAIIIFPGKPPRVESVALVPESTPLFPKPSLLSDDRIPS